MFPPTGKELMWAAIGAAAIILLQKHKASKSS